MVSEVLEDRRYAWVTVDRTLRRSAQITATSRIAWALHSIRIALEELGNARRFL